MWKGKYKGEKKCHSIVPLQNNVNMLEQLSPSLRLRRQWNGSLILFIAAHRHRFQAISVVTLQLSVIFSNFVQARLDELESNCPVGSVSVPKF